MPSVVRQPRIRLAARIWIAGSALLLLLLALFAFALHRLRAHDQADRMEQSLDRAGSALRRGITGATWEEGRLPGLSILGSVLPDGSAGWVMPVGSTTPAASWPDGVGSVEWPDGLLSRTETSGSATGLAVAAGERYTARGMRIPGEANRAVGVAVVGIPLAPLEREARADRLVLLALLGTSFLAGAVLLGFLALRLTRPLPDLMEASRRLELGDLDHRTVPTTRDELGVLGHTLNDAAASLKRGRSQLRQLGRVRAWRDVARRVAHEIKNPLAGMRVAAENLQRAASRDEETLRAAAAEAAEVVGEEVRALTRLADTFHSLARLPEPSATPVDLNALAEHAASLARAEAPSGVEVQVDTDPDLPTVRADEGQIGQVLKNLLKNGLEALGDGPGRILVTSLRRRGGIVEVLVEDNGPGVSEDDLDWIFEPYRTTKREGTGLGLPLSRQIAQLHGGDLEVGGGSEGGACFSLTLPVEGPAGEETADE